MRPMQTTAARVAATLTLVVTSAAATPVAAWAKDNSAQRFVLVATDLSGSGHLTATGPVHGVGTDTILSHTLNPDGTFTDVDLFDLPGGQVTLRDTYTVQFTSNPRTCVTLLAVEGDYSIVDATGEFAGATGSGTFTAEGTFVADRDETGTCLGFESAPVAFREVVHGTGTTLLL